MYTQITPWPTQRNGIADYAFELTKHSRSSFCVITEALQPKMLENVCFARPLQFNNFSSNKKLFHIGNNLDHVYMAPLFLKEPGVVILHDAALHYLAENVDAVIPGFFRSMLEYTIGSDVEKLMRLWRSGLKRGIDYTELRCLSWLKDAPAIIVHSNFAKRIVEYEIPGVPVFVIPHFAYKKTVSDRSIYRSQLRALYDIPEQKIVISALGFVTRNKQYSSIIKCL